MVVHAMKDTPPKPAVFLDRDGTLIPDPGYTGAPDVVKLLPGVPDALRKLASASFRLVIVTNQSAIGRGYFSAEQVESVNARACEDLAALGVIIDAVYYCPHTPADECTCRKPRPGMLLRAADDLGIDLPQSIMIGDKPSDVEAGDAAGCRMSILLTPEPSGSKFEAIDLPAAVKMILA